MLVSAGSFAHDFSQMQGKDFSPGSQGDPQMMLPTPGSLPSFPNGALPSLLGATLAVAQTSKFSDFALCSS